MIQTPMGMHIKRAGAFLLSAALVFTNVDMPALFAAEEMEENGKTEETGNILTPFEGQWKYFGQNKKLLEGEHYILDRETEEKGWLIGVESENVGKHKYVLTGSTGDIQLAKDAPTFEVREYKVEEGTEASLEIPVINKSYEEDNDSVQIIAPEGYVISDNCKTDSTTVGGPGNHQTNSDAALEDEEVKWGQELEIPLERLSQGDNSITYYLRSNAADFTRGAIDQTPKIIKLPKDTILPVITSMQMEDVAGDVTAMASLVSNESGTYYYMTVPEGTYSLEDEGLAELIQSNVKSHIGIVGFGRMDGGKQVNLNISGLSPQTDYQIFAVVLDKAGNESQVKAISFSTDKMTLNGEVQVSGNVTVGSTLTAIPQLKSADAQKLSYQWYRIHLTEDETELNKAYDFTGGGDDQETDEGDEEDNDEEDEDDEGDDEEEGLNTIAMTECSQEAVSQSISLEEAEAIEGATAQTYKVTKEDIGYRLIACVTEETYSGNLIGSTSTFVPKLMPVYRIPVLGKTAYSPNNRLSGIKLPTQWYWMDNSITPVCENNGYRARFVPVDRQVYKTVIVRIQVPVTRREIKKSWVSIGENTAYTGKEIKDNFKIKDSKYKLVNGKDYEATYFRNRNLGKATVKIKGQGNYKGTVKVTYEIVRKSISKVSCKYTKTKVYTGKNRKIYMELKNDSQNLKEGRDYTVTYKNNQEIGKATVYITGKGNYKGKMKLNFSIVPRKPKISARKKGKGIRVDFTSKEKIKGYQLYLSTSRSFSSKDTHQYIVTGNRFGVEELQKGTYYVRAKAYTVKKGKTYSSAYSSIKKVIIKK